LGTGLHGPATGIAAEAIEWINQRFLGHVLAIDLPSGLEADSGGLHGPAVCADATVTFTAPKLCHLLTPASVCCGKTWVAPIGTPDFLLEQADFNIELITRSNLSPVLQPREISAHKGDFGRILILAGSRGKSGAAAMAGLAALRSGAGLVKIAVPSGIQTAVSGFSAECMTEGLPETDAGFFSAEAATHALYLAQSHDVVAIGPGIGQEPATAQFLHRFLRDCPCPLVLDADAINCISTFSIEIPATPGRIMVVTPHPGEMARWTKQTAHEIQQDRLAIARRVSREKNLFVILKGARTLITAPDGRVCINPTGNPGMATAGSGDVLTGMVASILAQQLLQTSGIPDTADILQALGTAVFWHGLAGDAAASRTGQQTLIATDLIRQLPETYTQLVQTEHLAGGGLRALIPELT